MAARLSPEEWIVARTRWECDPRTGYVWLMKELSLPVSDVAIIKRAKKEGWTKQVSLKTIANRAQIKADQAFSPILAIVEGTEVSPNSPELVSRLTEQSVDLRTEVIEKHRREWLKHSNDWDIGVYLKSARIKVLRDKYANSDLTEEEIAEEIQARLEKGFDVDVNYFDLGNFARYAKTFAETIKLRQDGERKAWGLGAIAEDTNSGVESPEYWMPA
jgi:hypothetical protein